MDDKSESKVRCFTWEKASCSISVSIIMTCVIHDKWVLGRVFLGHIFVVLKRHFGAFAANCSLFEIGVVDSRRVLPFTHLREVMSGWAAGNGSFEDWKALCCHFPIPGC